MRLIQECFFFLRQFCLDRFQCHRRLLLLDFIRPFPYFGRQRPFSNYDSIRLFVPAFFLWFGYFRRRLLPVHREEVAERKRDEENGDERPEPMYTLGVQGLLQVGYGLITVFRVLLRAAGYHLIIFGVTGQCLKNLSDGIDVGTDIHRSALKLLRGSISIRAVSANVSV